MNRNENGLKKAVAMAYNQQDLAPRVLAKGYGAVAEAMIALARQHGVYVHESPDLLKLLLQVDQDKYIPPELYGIVAELLAWLYALEKRAEGPAGLK